MIDTVEQRLHALEQQVAELAFEVSGRALASAVPAVEVAVAQPAVRTADEPPAAASDPMSWTPPRYPRAPLMPVAQPRLRASWDLERLLGGRVLALVGGVAVVVGIALFVAFAVGRGWVGVPERVALAASASGALLVAGCWLDERGGRLQAALAMVGTAIAGLFLTLTAATAGYHLVPGPAGGPLALGIGALATAIAVRWDTRTVAGLGLGGALAAPLLAQTLTTGVPSSRSPAQRPNPSSGWDCSCWGPRSPTSGWRTRPSRAGAQWAGWETTPGRRSRPPAGSTDRCCSSGWAVPWG